MRFVYGKSCHFPVELEHQAYWATKKLNLKMKATGEKRLLQLVELDEFCLRDYENANLYKVKTKRWHARKIQDRVFELRQLVLLFNSRSKLFWGKLRSKWSGPFEVVQMTHHGAVELWNKEKTEKFLVNRQFMKHYWANHKDKHNVSITFTDENEKRHRDREDEKKVNIDL
ncbi:uncharacterized protein LOC107874279 [Capsicum annuum]|uniref:uncharacterized protein LOC107874279 n=1 Tax=Capsicum annuum TaxID=4072 RepID=UPI0007BF7E70|nr:uncharacterized protein LOC107874279 [Capsicum annuum]